ncbi:MAG: hypothetical protein WC989_05075 [Micavibrio sp.]
MSRRMKIIFTVSLLLNIVFAAAGAGLFFNFTRELPIPPHISPEARHFIARTYQEGREEIRPLIESVKTQRAAVEKIVTAEEFDAEAYRDAARKMLDTRAQISSKRAEIMGRALEDLPAEDRREFARNIMDGLQGHKPRKGGYHGRMMHKKQDRQEDRREDAQEQGDYPPPPRP